MKITAIIPTMNRLSELARCLETLRSQTRRVDELLVIDACRDPEVAVLARTQEGHFQRVGYHPFHPGLTQARNHGVRRSTGDIIVFLDDDLLLEPDFIREIARPFELDRGRTLAGVSGDIVNHSRNGARLSRLFKILFQLPYDGNGRFRLSGAPTMAYGRPEEREVEFLPGGLTAWRREVFAEFSFDENLPGIGVNEDVDFSYRVSRKWRNRYAPKARVRHLRPPASLARDASWAHLRMEFSGYWYLYRKNQGKDPIHLAAFLWHGVGVFLRFAFRRARGWAA